jgi:hypothetical protein
MWRKENTPVECVGGCPMLRNYSEISDAGDRVPPELASILLVEADPELRSSRRLLLGSLQYPVLAVSGYRDVCCLPADSNCCLVAIGLGPSEHEAQRVAYHVRKTWPSARILLLDVPSQNFEDPLYDDSVRTLWNPSAVIKAALRLIETSQPPVTSKDRRNFDADIPMDIDKPRS